MIPRILLCLVITVIMALGLNAFLVCHAKGRPITGLRFLLCRGLVKTGVILISVIGFFTYPSYRYLTLEDVNHYEEYLGSQEEQRRYQDPSTPEHPDVPKRGPGRASAVVCNHIGFMEILNLIVSPLAPSFTPKDDVAKIPIVNGIADSIQCMYVARAGTPEAKDALVRQFIERQKAIECGNEGYAPLCIFAEATTTNGTRIIPFKRGAFEGMRTVIPSFYSITAGQISPTYEIIDLVALLMLIFSSLYFRFGKINIMPEFVPNPTMLEKHDDKGIEPWQIYAWCVRDAISKHSGIPVLDEKLSLKDKLKFEALMNGKADRVEINGHYFEYDDDEPVQEIKISARSNIRRKSTITYNWSESDIGGINRL